MNDPISFHVTMELTSLQAEMLMKLAHQGLPTLLNMGWRKPEEWVEVVNKLTAALAFARGNPHYSGATT